MQRPIIRTDRRDDNEGKAALAMAEDPTKPENAVALGANISLANHQTNIL